MDRQGDGNFFVLMIMKMKYLSVTVLLLCFLQAGAQLSPQSKKVTETFFPEMELDIQTPAFEKKRGFTKYEEMMAFLNDLVKKHGQELSLKYIGESQKGKKIPILFLNRPQSQAKKLNVWIQAGMHGNEPASTEGILYLLQQLLQDPQYEQLLDRMKIAVVPMVNIDGYEKQDRYAANGLDLNRDQTKLSAPESRYLKKAFSDFGAEVAMDFHEYRPYRRDFAQLSTYGVTSRFDAMFLYSGNLNVPQNLRTFTQSVFVKNAKEAMEAHDLRHHDYVSTTRFMGDIIFNQGSINSRSSATSFALTNAVSCLFEVRGVGLGRTSFKRRTFTTFLLASSFLQTAYEHVEEVKKQIAEAVATGGEAVVTSERQIREDIMPMIDLDKNKDIDLQVELRDAWNTQPVLTRKRPTAYLILPTATQAIERLEILGLKLRPLGEEKKVEVESYEVQSYLRYPLKYEGVHRQVVTTQTAFTEKTFPPGTLILSLDQPKSNLAIEVLEPEAPNSFVSFSVIPTQKGAELPVYRYLKTPQL
jgi:hypothetical protein